METLTTGRADVDQMFTVHRGFRREFVLTPRLIRDAPDGDVRRAEVLADHLELALVGLHLHHTGEDLVLWPRLMERAAPSTGLVETMQLQHDAVDLRTAQVRDALGAWRRGPTPAAGSQLADLVDVFAAELFEHLDLEEREVVPLIARHITPEEWEMLAEHGAQQMTPRQMVLLFGAAVEEASPAEAASMLSPLPRPVRFLLRTVGAWQYRRHIRRVRGS